MVDIEDKWSKKLVGATAFLQVSLIQHFSHMILFLLELSTYHSPHHSNVFTPSHAQTSNHHTYHTKCADSTVQRRLGS